MFKRVSLAVIFIFINLDTFVQSSSYLSVEWIKAK